MLVTIVSKFLFLSLFYDNTNVGQSKTFFSNDGKQPSTICYMSFILCTQYTVLPIDTLKKQKYLHLYLKLKRHVITHKPKIHIKINL